jgi:TonB-dependent SusC/RagA subfamily outer membrane receptor
LNGYQVHFEEFKKISPDKVESVMILKDTTATEINEEIGNNDAIHVKTKKEISKGEASSIEKLMKAHVLMRAYTSFGDNQPLILVDGQELKPKSLVDIKQEDIQSFSVLKDKTATDLYGEKGKDGVISVITKKYAAETGDNVLVRKIPPGDEIRLIEPMLVIDESLSSESSVLFILDGKELSSEEIKSLSPDKIESVSILKDTTAAGVYGEKGKNGVIVIVTKKP